MKEKRTTDLVELILRGWACVGMFFVYVLYYGSAAVFMTMAEGLSRTWELTWD